MLVFWFFVFEMLRAEHLLGFTLLVIPVPLMQLAVAIHTFLTMMQRVVLSGSHILVEDPLRKRVVYRENVREIRIKWFGRPAAWLDAEARVTVVTNDARHIRFPFKRADVSRDGCLAESWPELLRTGPRRS